MSRCFRLFKVERARLKVTVATVIILSLLTLVLPPQAIVEAEEASSGNITEIERTLYSNTYVYANGTSESYISPNFANYFNGKSFIPINTSIVPSDDPLFDWMVKEGIYETYFKTNPSTVETVKFWYNSSRKGEHPHKVGYVTFQPLSLNYRNALDMVQQVSIPQTISGYSESNIFVYPNIFGSGVNLTYKYATDKLKEYVTIKTRNSLSAPEDWILQQENVTLDLDFYLVYPEALQPYMNRELWDKTDKTTSSSIQFKKDNITMFYLGKPIAYDSNMNITEISYQLKFSAKKTNVLLKVPFQWLNSTERVFPITIDPTISFYSDEDLDLYAERTQSSPDWEWDGPASYHWDANWIRAGYLNQPGVAPLPSFRTVYRGYLSFNTSSIDDDATVSSTVLCLKGKEPPNVDFTMGIRETDYINETYGNPSSNSGDWTNGGNAYSSDNNYATSATSEDTFICNASSYDAGGGWTDPQNAYDSDDANTGTITDGSLEVWKNYDIPTGDLTGVSAIYVGLELEDGDDNDYVTLQVSKDGGSTYGAEHNVNFVVAGLTWIDVSGDYSWVPSYLTNANFRVKLTYTKTGKANWFYIDWIPVKVVDETREHIYSNYGFNEFQDNNWNISRVMVGVEQYGDGDDYVDVRISKDGGSSWESPKSATAKSSDDNSTEWLDCTGALNWNSNPQWLNDTYFQVKIEHKIGGSTANTLYLDYIPVKIIWSVNEVWDSTNGEVLATWETTNYVDETYNNISIGDGNVDLTGLSQYKLYWGGGPDLWNQTSAEYVDWYSADKGSGYEPILKVTWSIIAQYSITFYFHTGGTLLVNGTNRDNGTATDYDENTVLNITGVNDEGYVFLNHVYDSSETIDNPFYLTVTQDYETHTYFSLVSVLSNATYIMAGIITLLPFLFLITIVRRKS